MGVGVGMSVVIVLEPRSVVCDAGGELRWWTEDLEALYSEDPMGIGRR